MIFGIRNPMKRLLTITLFVFCAGILMAQTAERIRPTIVIGGDYNYPPYEYLEQDSNLPSGYNIELSRRLMEIMDRTPRFRLAKWSQVRTWLDSGYVDMVQGMALSSQRARDYYFSQPHTQTWRSIFVHKGSGIKSSADLLNARIVLQQGDIARDFLHTIEFKGTVVEVPTQEDALKFLDKGVYDAALINHMHGMYLIDAERLQSVSVLWEQILVKDYCYASRDKDLIDEIDAALVKLTFSGELDALHKKWFATYQVKNPIVGIFSDRLVILIMILAISGIVLSWVFAFLLYRNRKQASKLSDRLALSKRREEELLREHKLFDSSPIVVYKCRANPLRMDYISPSIGQWGYSSEEIMNAGVCMLDLMHEDDRQTMMGLIEKYPQSDPKTMVKQYRIFDAKKELRWVYDYGIIITDESDEQYSYGFLLDITTQKNLEADLIEARDKAESASITKGYFLASMSHEIRTPLNGIIGLINVLKEKETDLAQKEIMEMINSSGKTLMGIVSNILDFSKIESGKMELMSAEFNPRYLVEELVKGFVIQREKAGIDIRSRIGKDIPDIVVGDMLRVRQILTNLLQNAIKYTDQGWVELSAEVYTLGEDEIRILFSVSDTGIGIDKTRINEIFDQFGHTDSSMVNSYGGAGLGLSIVKKLVELMNGFIWVESEPGQGSKFFALIPFRLSIESVEPPAGLDDQTSLSGMKILFVEDDPISQKVTRHQLEKWGMQVDMADNGHQALELYDTNHYDVILLDLQLPKMDGITVCKLIREHESKIGRRSKIIALTAAATEEDRIRCMEAGMSDFISKPFDFKVLQAKITI